MNWAIFVSGGTTLAAVIWVLQRQHWRLSLRVLVCFGLSALLGAVYVFGVIVNATQMLGKEVPWYNTSPWCEIIFYVLMVMGMAARYITRAIQNRQAQIARLREQETPYVKPPLEFDAWEFSYPLFISVITFGALISQIQERSLSVTNATLSFQTGFFWQTLLAARQRS